jgi:hypothetical protein
MLRVETRHAEANPQWLVSLMHRMEYFHFENVPAAIRASLDSRRCLLNVVEFE